MLFEYISLGFFQFSACEIGVLHSCYNQHLLTTITHPVFLFSSLVFCFVFAANIKHYLCEKSGLWSLNPMVFIFLTIGVQQGIAYQTVLLLFNGLSF